MNMISISRRDLLNRVPNESDVAKFSISELYQLYERLAGKFEILNLPLQWPKSDQYDFKGLTREERQKKEHDIISNQCALMIVMIKKHFAGHSQHAAASHPHKASGSPQPKP